MKSPVCHFVFFCSALAMIAGCGTTASTGNVTSGVTISGTLSGTRDSDEALRAILSVSTSISSYTVNCVTLSGTASSCSGTCDSSGGFSCGPLPTGVPFGCFVEQSGNIVAVLAFTSSTTGLNNTSTSQGSVVAGSGATGMNLGEITLNTSTGTAVVTMANVTTTGGSGPSTTSTGVSTFANLEDIHGWTIQATPAAQLPPNVQTATSSGNGPTLGQTIFLAQYEATDTSNNTHVGLSIWNGGANASSATTDYTGCTTGGGEGAQLPSGFTAIAGPNNNASLLTGALQVSDNLPDPAHTKVSDGGPAPSSVNPGVCGITGLNSSTDNCTLVPTEPGFINPNPASDTHSGTVGGDGCIFLCTMNDIGHATGGSCTANVNVNWGLMGPNTFQKAGFDPYWNGSSWTDVSGAVSFVADVTPPSGAAKSYFGGAVVYQGGNPGNRFMFGELIVSAGGIGTMSNQQPTQTITICTINPGNTGCPVPDQATCHLTELDQLTITETAASGANATSAVVQLVQNRTLQSGDPTQCPSALSSNGNSVGQSMYMFNIVAN